MPTFHRHHRQELDILVEEYTTQYTMSRRVFLQRATAAGLSVSAASVLLAGCGGASAGTTAKVNSIDVLTGWGGEELDSFNAIHAAFTQKTGIKVTVESTRDVSAVLQTRLRGNNPPDVVDITNLDLFHRVVDQGKVVALDKFMDMNKYKQDYAQAWIDLTSYKGTLYSVLIKANNKVNVWYNPKEFQVAGGKVPQTWDDLIAVSDKLVSTGKYPWAMGVESSASSGWPAADWISEIYINKYGNDMYKQWVQHKIPWTHPSVKDAIEMFGQIAHGNHYIDGAPQSILATNFQDASYQPFTSPPKSYMYYLGDFTAGFITSQFKTLKPGMDFNFFPFPTIDPQFKGAVTCGADFMLALKENDGTRQFMQYLATAEAQSIWVKRGGSSSVNRSVNLDDYPNPVVRHSAQLLANATSAELSVGDQVPAALQSVYWKGLLTYIGDPRQLDSALSSVESTALQVYQS